MFKFVQVFTSKPYSTEIVIKKEHLITDSRSAHSDL